MPGVRPKSSAWIIRYFSFTTTHLLQSVLRSQGMGVQSTLTKQDVFVIQTRVFFASRTIPQRESDGVRLVFSVEAGDKLLYFQSGLRVMFFGFLCPLFLDTFHYLYLLIIRITIRTPSVNLEGYLFVSISSAGEFLLKDFFVMVLMCRESLCFLLYEDPSSEYCCIRL